MELQRKTSAERVRKNRGQALRVLLFAGLLALVPAAARSQSYAGGAAARAAFDATVYPIANQYCTQCHGGSGPGFPHVAHVDAATAFRAVYDNQKVNLANPGASRMVRRLSPESHHCWGNCAANAAEMQAAIQLWADTTYIVDADPNRTGGELPPTLMGSAPSDVSEAVAVEVKRFKRGIIAQYEFDEGAGTTVYDQSDAFPAMHLAVEGDHAWIAGGGLEFQGGRAIASAESSAKLWNMIASGRGSQKYSIEAWIIPANTSQDGPARIVSYSNGNNLRNFMVGQNMYDYVIRNRNMSKKTDDNGEPRLQTNDDDEDLQARLQHFVVTYNPRKGRRIYVDGEFTGDFEPSGKGKLYNWNRDFRLVLGNETNNRRAWMGQIKRLVIYNQALSKRKILKNYRAGASQKFKMRFSLAEHLGANTYIEFDYSDFDGHSYLFCKPILVGKDKTTLVNGVRLAVNSITPVNSQAFGDVNIDVTKKNPEVSNRCTVVPKDLGPTNDRFAVSFEYLGALENVLVEAAPGPIPVDISNEQLPIAGIRNFGQVRDTLSAITGIPATTSPIPERYTELTQQLPESNDIRSFVSSHQVAISKIALEYCDLLVEMPNFRNAFFGTSFSFGADASVAFDDPVDRGQVLNPLVDSTVSANLAQQPDPAIVYNILDGLVDDLTVSCVNAGDCVADRTETVVKAVCAASLSNAAAMMH